MGNVIATRTGKPDGKRIMLAAHMDEIGLMVRYIDKNGFIKFSKIGGINDQMLMNQEVTIRTSNGDVTGVIGSKPPHRMKEAERKKITDFENMFIDIGASDKEMLNPGLSLEMLQQLNRNSRHLENYTKEKHWITE